jgi:hypothetical protein
MNDTDDDKSNPKSQKILLGVSNTYLADIYLRGLKKLGYTAHLCTKKDQIINTYQKTIQNNTSSFFAVIIDDDISEINIIAAKILGLNPDQRIIFATMEPPLFLSECKNIIILVKPFSLSLLLTKLNDMCEPVLGA